MNRIAAGVATIVVASFAWAAPAQAATDPCQLAINWQIAHNNAKPIDASPEEADEYNAEADRIDAAIAADCH